MAAMAEFGRKGELSVLCKTESYKLYTAVCRFV